MRYTNTDLLSRLAAEYVIGTLRGPARRRFGRLLDSSAEAQSLVQFWDSHLDGDDEDFSSVCPPAQSRRELLRIVQQESPRHHGFRRAAVFLGGLAAAIAATVWLGERDTITSTHSIAARQSELQDHYAEVPIYLTKVGIPASSMQWLVSASADRRHVIVVAGGDFPQIGRHKVELWYQDGSAKLPMALGQLPVERGATVSFDLPPMAQPDTPLSFAISLEPQDGLRTRPRGPVLDTKAALDSV